MENYIHDKDRLFFNLANCYIEKIKMDRKSLNTPSRFEAIKSFCEGWRFEKQIYKTAIANGILLEKTPYWMGRYMTQVGQIELVKRILTKDHKDVASYLYWAIRYANVELARWIRDETKYESYGKMHVHYANNMQDLRIICGEFLAGYKPNHALIIKNDLRWAIDYMFKHFKSVYIVEIITLAAKYRNDYVIKNILDRINVKYHRGDHEFMIEDVATHQHFSLIKKLHTIFGKEKVSERVIKKFKDNIKATRYLSKYK
jgi:hypothetical protein